MLRALLVLACAASACGARAAGGRHGFYRSMWGAGAAGARRAGDTRRVFGGTAAALSSFPAVCVLLDRYFSSRCSAAVVAPQWVLTAAHCVSTDISYVKYNSRHPAGPDGEVSVVVYLYRHPGYEVLEQNEGRGMDVTLLHHDVGLVRTSGAMTLASPPALEPASTWRLYNLEELQGEEVQVLGFGRSETSSQGEELFEVRLRLVGCERSAWEYCVCGMGVAGAGGSDRGVCSGDSGGPVLYRGAQVGVTSMGPLECASSLTESLEGGSSVFTSLYPYVDLVNDTIQGTEKALRMRGFVAASSHCTASAGSLALGAGLAAAFFARPAR